MRALKLQVDITDSSRLVVELPPGVSLGRAELILLTPDDDEPQIAAVQSLKAHLVRALQRPVEQSRAQLDERMSVERAAWD